MGRALSVAFPELEARVDELGREVRSVTEWDSADLAVGLRAAVAEVAAYPAGSAMPVLRIPHGGRIDTRTSPIALPPSLILQGAPEGVQVSEFGNVGMVELRHTGMVASDSLTDPAGCFSVSTSSKDWQFSGISFRGDATTKVFVSEPLDSTRGKMHYATLDRVSFNQFHSVYTGPQLGVTWSGKAMLNNMASTALYLAGSDNHLFTDGGYFEMGLAAPWATRAQLKAMIRLGHWSKSTIGPMYLTGSPTTPLRLDYGVGGNVLSGVVLEGRPDPDGAAKLYCAGELAYITGGGVRIRARSHGYAMADPAATTRATSLAYYVINGANAQVTIDGGTFMTYAAASYPGGTIPRFARVLAGRLRVRNIDPTPGVTTKPVVSTVDASLVSADDSVTVVVEPA